MEKDVYNLFHNEMNSSLNVFCMKFKKIWEILRLKFKVKHGGHEKINRKNWLQILFEFISKKKINFTTKIRFRTFCKNIRCFASQFLFRV